MQQWNPFAGFRFFSLGWLISRWPLGLSCWLTCAGRKEKGRLVTSWEVFWGVLRRPKVPAGVKFGKPSKKALAHKKDGKVFGEKSYFVLGGGGTSMPSNIELLIAVAKRSNGSGRVCIDTSPESLAAKREQVDGPTQIPWMNKYRMAYDLHDLHE